MSKRPDTPARRKRRAIRWAAALPVLLAVLTLALDFPIPTARQALAATQERFLFGPGEVVTQLDFPRSPSTQKWGQYDRYYILRSGDWYAWCGVNHYGLFWQSGGLGAVKNDSSLPLVPLTISDWADGAVLVLSNSPDIAAVEIAFHSEEGRPLLTAWETQPVQNCFVVRYQTELAWPSVSATLQVRGYGTGGELLYESPRLDTWRDMT